MKRLLIIISMLAIVSCAASKQECNREKKCRYEGEHYHIYYYE